MKTINYTLEKKIIENNIEIFPNPVSGNLVLNMYDKYYMEDSYKFLKEYYKKIYELNYNYILVGGLGLGILPYYLINKNYNVDVVEIDYNLIKLINKMNYLNGVNIINDDAIFYNTDKKYDLIVMDLWWIPDDNFPYQKNNIIKNYSNNLTENGKIYFPLIDEIL